MTEKKELKRLPGYSIGVRVNGAIRMIKLARPICPYSQVEYTVDLNGNRRKKERGPNEMNCQLAGGRWWERCEAKGHNPYFSVKKWYEPVDVLDDDGMVVGEKRIPHTEEMPNVKAVAVTKRHNSGQGAVRAIRVKGCKRLSDIGYEEVCQFRSCQEPVTVRTRSFGEYCSDLHLSLVAADAQGTALTYVDRVDTFAPDQKEKLTQRRKKELREARAFAD